MYALSTPTFWARFSASFDATNAGARKVMCPGRAICSKDTDFAWFISELRAAATVIAALIVRRVCH